MQLNEATFLLSLQGHRKVNETAYCNRKSNHYFQ